MLIMYLIIIIIYIILINLFKKKSKNYSFSTIEKENNLIKLYKFIKLLNISIMLIDFVYYFILFLLKDDINLIYFVTNILLIVLSIIFDLKLNILVKNIKNNFNYVLLNEYEHKYRLIFIYNIIISLVLYKRVGDINNFLILTNSFFILSILIIIDIVFLIKFMIINKKNVCFNIDKEKDYIENIEFKAKIEFSSFYNYIIYILIYIILIYCNIPFAYLLYSLISLILLIVIKNKISKLCLEQKKLYQNVTFINNKPGIIYAFLFYREIEFIKNMLITVLFIVLSLIVFYMFDGTIFSYITIQLYILLIYEIFISKNKLIRLLSALDENFVNRNEYNIVQNNKISYIKKIHWISKKITFFKLIFIDNNNNIYNSELILYDPELYIKKIKLYLNSKDISDYIIMLDELYE